MMTPQEIIKEFFKLSPMERKEVIDHFIEDEKKSLNDDFADNEDNFEPLEIKEKPTSEIVVNERD